MPRIRHIVLGQSVDQFEAAGYPIDKWTGRPHARPPPPAALGRRRHARGVRRLGLGHRRSRPDPHRVPDRVEQAARAPARRADRRRRRRRRARGCARRSDAAASRAARRARPAVERRPRATCIAPRLRPVRAPARRLVPRVPALGAALVAARSRPAIPQGRPVYFVSSNSHSIANLLGGYARAHRDEIVELPAPPQPRGSRRRATTRRSRRAIRRSRPTSSTTRCARSSTSRAPRAAGGWRRSSSPTPARASARSRRRARSTSTRR